MSLNMVRCSGTNTSTALADGPHEINGWDSNEDIDVTLKASILDNST